MKSDHEIIAELCSEHECSPRELAAAAHRYTRSAFGDTANFFNSSAALHEFNTLTPHAQVGYFYAPVRKSSSVIAYIQWVLYVWAAIAGAAGTLFVAGLPIWLVLYFLYWAFV